MRRAGLRVSSLACEVSDEAEADADREGQAPMQTEIGSRIEEANTDGAGSKRIATGRSTRRKEGRCVFGLAATAAGPAQVTSDPRWRWPSTEGERGARTVAWPHKCDRFFANSTLPSFSCTSHGVFTGAVVPLHVCVFVPAFEAVPSAK